MKSLKWMLMFELAIIILTVPLRAGAPPPEALMNAKKVYLVNQTSDSKQFEALQDALTAWGRWEVVTNKEEADLTFTFFVEMKASSQTVQSCFTCPPSMVVTEKEIQKITIAGKDGTIFLATEKKKDDRSSAKIQAEKLLAPLRKQLDLKK
jgi:hypothetical protein